MTKNECRNNLAYLIRLFGPHATVANVVTALWLIAEMGEKLREQN